MQTDATEEWLTALQDAVAAGTFVSARLSKPNAAAGDLKTIDLRPIMVKRALKLSFTYHHRTRDVVKNYPPHEAAALLRETLLSQFAAARLCSTQADIQLAGATLSRHAPSEKAPPALTHDRAKHRWIESQNKPYLHALGIADAKGNVQKHAQDKFRQINKYIEILDGLITPLLPRPRLRIVDMGAGKGYLTFALYDYLTHTLKLDVEVVGVEFRADLVALCNDIARAAQFTKLTFVEGSIAAYDCAGADVVIALHACDTATDDAIAKAVRAEASLVVVAPCCHKQIRRAMASTVPTNPLHFLMKHGTYVERISEMVTDGLRAELLELSGYRTKLFEFISDAHTPKNVMIVGSKSATPLAPAAAEKLRSKIATTKAEFGIDQHYLETLLNA